MAVQPLEGNIINSDGLYVRTHAGVMGPYAIEALRHMAMVGILPSRGAVSLDKKNWRPAGSIRELFDKDLNLPGDDARNYEEDMSKPEPALAGQNSTKEIAVAKEELRILDELRIILRRISKRKHLSFFTSAPVIILLLLGMTSALLYASAQFSGLLDIFTWKRFWSFLSFSVPALFGLLAISSMAGNYLLYKVFGLSKTERRFLALYLQPATIEKLGWGAVMRNWILRGDWMSGRAKTNPQVYFHVFYQGVSRNDIASDVALWEELAQAVPYSLRHLCAPGGSIRQAQEVIRLPRWSTMLNELTDGHMLGSLLDQNYSKWADGILTHARSRLKLDAAVPIDFFLSFIEISEGKEALAVCVYPHSRDEDEADLPVATEIAA